MAKQKLNSMLIAASVALCLAAPATLAQPAPASSHAPTVGDVIAVQGNAALETIRAEMKEGLKVAKPKLPARVIPVSVPTAGSTPATAALAK